MTDVTANLILAEFCC